MGRWRYALVGTVAAVVAVAGVVLVRLPVGSSRSAVAAGVWEALPPAGVPGRSEPSVVWTRKAMIVWGGTGDSGVLGDGASYDLSRQTWSPLPPAPLSARRGHTAVWTGNRMLVYGGLGNLEGCEGICALGDGAAYDPNAGTWTPLSPAPLEPRSGHTAVWLQNRMVVWGGAGEGTGALADGASYDPITDSWVPLPPAPLAPRVAHGTVATTDRMLVWGGSSGVDDGGQDFADGAVYTPATGSWAPMAAPPGSLAPRDTFAAVWTGAQLLVWGGSGRGSGCTPCVDADGGAYELASDSWAPIAPSPLGGRTGHRAVWTGRDLLVWGGAGPAAQADGALYNPTDGSWAGLVPGPLPARQHQAMVWTGQQLLVWGGQNAAGKLADGAVLTLNAA